MGNLFSRHWSCVLYFFVQFIASPITISRDLFAGHPLEVVLAKPQTDKKSDGAYPYNAGPHTNHAPHPGYGGFAGNPYGSAGAGFGVAPPFQQVDH